MRHIITNTSGRKKNIYVFNKILYIKIVLIALLFSCTDSNLDEKTIKIDLHRNNNLIKVSEFVDSISYIALEYSKECIIGNVYDLCFMNGNFYIYDNLTKSIFIFDYKGNFKNKISSTGRGPGEYIEISGFSVNSVDSTVNVHDGGLKKILKYSPNGNFISEIKLTEYVRDFMCLNNGKYLFCTPDYNLDSKRGLWLANSEGEFEKQLIDVDDEFMFTPLFQWYLCNYENNKFGILGIDDDNIYHISNDDLQVAYKLILDPKIPKRILKKRSTEIVDSKDYIYNKTNYIETQKWFLISFINFNNKNNSIFIYSKEKETSILGDKLENDIDGILGIPTRTVIGNSFVSVVSQVTYFNSNSDKNPVLQVMHLK